MLPIKLCFFFFFGQKSCWNKESFKAGMLMINLWLPDIAHSFVKWLQNAILSGLTQWWLELWWLFWRTLGTSLLSDFIHHQTSRWGQSPRNSWQIFSQAWRLGTMILATGPGGSCGLRESVPLVMWFSSCFLFLGSLETLWASPSSLVSFTTFVVSLSIRCLWWCKCEYIFKCFPYSFSSLAF